MAFSVGHIAESLKTLQTGDSAILRPCQSLFLQTYKGSKEISSTFCRFIITDIHFQLQRQDETCLQQSFTQAPFFCKQIGLYSKLLNSYFRFEDQNKDSIPFVVILSITSEILMALTSRQRIHLPSNAEPQEFFKQHLNNKKRTDIMWKIHVHVGEVSTM